MLKISIPTPCHEDWDAMTPNTQGRHCNACVKTVVDFTNMSDEEVKYFFLHKKEERVCGRFKTEQLHRITVELPENIFYLRLPFWKKFLAACLLIFSTTLFSCETKLQGDIVAKKGKIAITNNEAMEIPKAPKLKIDTTNASVPKICTVTQRDTIVDIGNVVGIIEMPVPPEEEKGNIEVMPADTSITSKLPSKMGEVSIVAKDSLQIKNPLKADTSNCDTKTFY